MIIFLDIDGVLATEVTYSAWRKAGWDTLYPDRPYQGQAQKAWRSTALSKLAMNALLLDEECCKAVQALCDATGASLILSSSWREMHPLDDIREWLASKGLTAPLIGMTPTTGTHRGQQIAAVCEQMGLTAKDILILEDVEDVAPYNGRKIRTSFHGNRAGFRDRHLKQALKMAGK